MEIFPDDLHYETTKEKALKALCKYTSIAFCFLTVLILFRLFEFCLLSLTGKLPVGGSGLLSDALSFDIKLWMFISAWLLIPFMIFSFLGQKFGNILFYIIFGIILIIYLNLIFYFSVTMNPLGADLFAYSVQDIKTTVNASGALNVKNISVFILVMAGIFFLWKLLLRVKFNIIAGYAFLIACVISFISIRIPALVPKAGDYRKEIDYYLTSNKLGYFIAKNYKSSPEVAPVAEGLPATVTGGTKSFEYLSNDYPFLRKEGGEDALSSFLNADSVKPDFVFLIIEGLGRSFSGPNAAHGSFTPFLDSLSTKSLYWENFMSTAGRTFAVLPSVFGSLPFCNTGYNESSMSDHISLISLLKKNGYRTTFYYGGDASFDNMRNYVEKQKADNIYDSHNFENTYRRLPGNDEGFSWGYGDFDLYDKGIKIIKNIPGPSLNIILTVSTHSPFLIPNQEIYKKQATERINSLPIDAMDKEEHINLLKQYSTVIYADEALRKFFNDYATLPKYRNTVFIITGDHQMPEIPINTQTERFHVPLIIYSPMLKRAASFQGVCSQFDITPSIMNFMNKTYNVAMPPLTHWIGSGLDTSATFRAVKNYPLKRNKNELVDYISNEYLYSQGELFTLSDNLNMEKNSDDIKMAEIASLFQDFKNRNVSACGKKSLIPDSLKKYK